MSIKFLYRLAKQNCPIIEESPDKGSGIKTFNAFKSNTFDNYASRLLRFDNHFYWFLCQRPLFQPTNDSIRRKALPNKQGVSLMCDRTYGSDPLIHNFGIIFYQMRNR